eukprot:RCo018199
MFRVACRWVGGMTLSRGVCSRATLGGVPRVATGDVAELRWPRRSYGSIPEELDGLVEEHTIISTVTNALIGYVTLIDRGHKVDKDDLKKFTTFFREYMDRGHHSKEESVFFEAVLNNTPPSKHGIIPVLEGEHKKIRELISTLDRLCGHWDAMEVVRTAAKLVDLKEAHIRREEEGLFPMAPNKLTRAELQDMGSRMEEMEQSFQSRQKGDLEKLAAELAEKYPWSPESQ